MGNLDLDPGTTLTFELGGRHEQENLTLEVAAFYTIVSDVITRIPQSSTVSDTLTVNSSEAWITGIEAEAAWNFSPDWTLSGFLACQYGDSDRPSYIGGPEITEPISRLSPLRGSIALRYDTPSRDWWAEARLTGSTEADRLSAGDKGDLQRMPSGATPAYLTASLYAGWQATSKLQFNLALENLTNEDYRVH